MKLKLNQNQQLELETQLELEHRLARAPTDLRSFGEAELEVEHPDELAHLRSQIDSSAAQPDRRPTSSTPRASGVESDHEAAGGAAPQLAQRTVTRSMEVAVVPCTGLNVVL